MIVLGGSELSGSGNITFVTDPSQPGDYRLFGGSYGNPTLSNFLLPSAPVGDTYALSTTAENNFIDLVVTSTAVLSGGTWTTNGNGSWTQGTNWSCSPTVPSSGTVAFAGAATSPVTVTLDGPQSAGALVFNNANAYTLSAGTVNSASTLTLGMSAGASVTVLSGTHFISAPVVLAGSLAVSTTGGGVLVLAGSVSDGGAGYGLTLSNGELILSGTGSYGGPTTVDGGTMYLTSSTALPSGGALIVGAGGDFIFDPSVTAGPAAGSLASPHGAGLVAVPEPSALALLALGALAAALAARRGKKPGNHGVHGDV
jgi:autotransporter-associated beta strand protein